MQSLGIVRKVDHLGRIVIPKELRRSLGLDQGVPLEIFVDNDKIILRKYVVDEACVITGEISLQNKKLSNGMYISPRGAELLKKEIEDYKTWE
ncbi:AbrB/MazE/SpoVT family DNA-binding domain-containing protein [Sporosarcina thermotolerans]|uniref:AbrB/MazE/SpoVT family DNA-binding domain-containing protein n=1 Tax=Sporosarcina thermotolerans TaxID=633404 RepID=A0AAW9A7B5_9BACL|nr:AbrB/MazE/SpoVT family DNA-binding domain-containing protein [Sporosarcina thermotolerans]MDW0117067.1 AbrB/MazE/SpoVT family DNA-binding domain-containing protein [Sporosarcina thermotolerans]